MKRPGKTNPAKFSSSNKKVLTEPFLQIEITKIVNFASFLTGMHKKERFIIEYIYNHIILHHGLHIKCPSMCQKHKFELEGGISNWFMRTQCFYELHLQPWKNTALFSWN